ncbi:hypothetical protein FKP32DRAFT_265975 [Trametes sanguinea]|nr:hypothetical protein FKP32DRAFT_265975 [Trametes sanguinea]
MPLVICKKCRGEELNNPDPEYRPARDSRYFSPGDIWAIREGTQVPVYLILNGQYTGYSIPTHASTGGFSTSTSYARSTALGHYNARPCIIMRRAAMSSPHGCTVCLMATFSGSTRLEDLPEVLRVYCIPLSPHGLLRRRPGAKHIHTSPEWPKENTWVIARKFDTYGNLVGRWENRASDDPTASSYTLDRESQAVLAQSEKERRIQWELSCAEDQTLRKRCDDEYKVSEISHTCLWPSSQRTGRIYAGSFMQGDKLRRVVTRSP